MKKNKRIPTLIALFLLVCSVTAGVVLIKSGSKWFTKATPKITPRSVNITNISESGFTVSWITDEKVSGLINYGDKENLSFTAFDDRDQLSGQQEKFLTHHVTLKGLKPETNYFFKINSGGIKFDNNGQPYQVKTGTNIKENIPSNDIAYGTILKQDGSPAEGVIVYLSLTNASPLSTLTKSSGSWAIPLNLARSTDLSSWATYDREASIEEIFVQGGTLGTATAIAVTKYDNPLPAITLGSNFDFREGPINPTPTPTQQISTSKFQTKIEEKNTPEADLKIISPSNGEKVNTLKPEIMGTGPAGESLTIIINSPEVITSQITINKDGSWNWTPPSNLSPGKHTVTISLANGQKISHSFVVLAAGESELPSFTASPSANYTPTPSPTPTLTPTLTSSPTPTIKERTSLPSTEGGVPKSGNFTPTFFFSILGIVLIIFGGLGNILFKKI